MQDERLVNAAEWGDMTAGREGSGYTRGTGRRGGGGRERVREHEREEEAERAEEMERQNGRAGRDGRTLREEGRERPDNVCLPVCNVFTREGETER